MLEVIEAVYKNGAFVPEKFFDFPEGARVKIVVETVAQESETKSNVQEPTITDPEERKKILKIIQALGRKPDSGGRAAQIYARGNL